MSSIQTVMPTHELKVGEFWPEINWDHESLQPDSRPYPGKESENWDATGKASFAAVNRSVLRYAIEQSEAPVKPPYSGRRFSV